MGIFGDVRICIREEKTEVRGDKEVITGYEYKTKVVPSHVLRKRLGARGWKDFINFVPVRFEGHQHVTLS